MSSHPAAPPAPPTRPASPPASQTASAPQAPEAKPSNFLRQIIEHDLQAGTYASRRWGGSPGDAAHHAAGVPDPARIRTRFPPEPNGYLHIGHAKSICLNFGLARDYGGVCHLRFDDTNPEKEEQEYVDAIDAAVRWLGFDWQSHCAGRIEEHRYFASDYFDFMYRAAEYLVQAGHAYVDEQSAEAMRAHRGDFNRPGTNSPYRSRSPADNLERLRQMRAGLHPDGSMVLRAKIDMASPNLNLRDPALYRIRRATHHRSGDAWGIYPMYTYAHPIEDALEQITHSICTLEFEDQRPFYDWLLERLAEGGLLQHPLPRQYEFARLNLTYVLTSKRKLAQLVNEGRVRGWDDPRLPTLAGLRRRGYTPSAIRLFAERIGASKSDSWIDYASLEGCLREDLEHSAPRAMAVLEPLKLVLSNWADVYGNPEHTESCTLPALPHTPEGQIAPTPRQFLLGRELWIERDDFAPVPPKGYKRLHPPQPDPKDPSQCSPGSRVRLKGAYVIECTGFETDASGHVTAVHAVLLPGTKSGSPGADSVKAKAAITWVAAADAVAAEVRLYERLFNSAQPEAGGADFLQALNPDSLQVRQAWLEPTLAQAQPEQRFQFERHGYFVADRHDHRPGQLVFNRIAALKDSWGK